jgi:hypothetical protein
LVAPVTGTAAVAMPLSATALVGGVALWMMVSVPVLAPTTLGENFTLTTQLAPGASTTDAPQVLTATEKSALPAPPIALELTVNGEPPLLVRVTVEVADDAPTAVDAKAIVDTLVTAAAGAATVVPVPDKLTVELPPAALWLTVSVAARAPAALGVKLITIVQLPPAAMLLLDVQLPPLTVNSVLPVEMPDRLSAAVPALLTVTDWLAAAVPTGDAPNASDAAESDAVGPPAVPAGLAM